MATPADARTLSDAVPARVAHVYPCYGREHATDGVQADCWCKPRVELKGLKGGAVIVHREQN